MEPQRVSWTFHVDASPAEVWTYVRDTDRFNRAAGLGYRFEESVDASGRVVRNGRLHKFGVEILWEEQPFEIEAPYRWKSARLYAGGPVERSSMECRLTDEGGRTRIDFDLAITPRHWLARPVVALDIATTTRPVLGRTLEHMVELIAKGEAPFDPPVPPIPAEVMERLERELLTLEPKPVAHALLDTLVNERLTIQDRLQPLAFALALDADPDETIGLFLEATRLGILELRWELICPSCRGGKGVQASLAMGAQQHCPSCNIVYDGSFVDAVEVVFRPTPEVRLVEVAVECILSPSRTPHVLGQAQLEPGGEVELTLDLRPGGYRLSTGPMQPGASIEVREGLRTTEVTVDAQPNGVFPPILRVGPGRVRVFVRSRRDDPVWVRLDERARPPTVLTAGRLLEHPGVRDLLPPEAVHPGLDVAARRGAVLVAEQVQDPKLTGMFSGAFEGNGVSVRRFDTLDAAFRAAVDSWDDALAMGIAEGPVVELRQEGEEVFAGGAVDAALEVARTIGGGELGLPSDQVEALLPVIEEAGARVITDDEVARLWLPAMGERLKNAIRSEPDTESRDRVGSWVVGRELGRGGMGLVLEATGPQGEPAVVKLLLPGLADHPDHAQRFYNEARITAHVQHPNVVRVLDYGVDEGRMYMVMERLQGHELLEEPMPLSASRVRELGVQLLAGLQAAHDADVVHRDVKPANIFVLDDGSVKLIDFGIAVPVTKEDDPECLQILGTPHYMSPEQAECDPIDGRSDLYSLGLVLYECLTGELPFDAPSALALVMVRIHRPPVPIQEHGDVEPKLAEVVMRALELDPPRRFPDAQAMRTALEEI